MRNRVRQILKTLNISNPPIPIERIAEFFSIKVVLYPNFPVTISGTLTEVDGSNVMGINSTQARTRQRFSIAHELGHFLLGHNSSDIIDDSCGKNPNEREADSFAGEILVPYDFLKKDIEKEWNIPLLAQRYEVSEQVMSIRLLETGFINKIKPLKK